MSTAMTTVPLRLHGHKERAAVAETMDSEDSNGGETGVATAVHKMAARAMIRGRLSSHFHFNGTSDSPTSL
jgi:hypothetical protein